MNILFKSMLVIAAVCCFNFAQAQKIAHLNFDSLISLMPETKTATEAANNYLKGLEQELLEMQTEFEKKYKDYMAIPEGTSDILKNNKQQDLEQLQARIQEFQRKAEIDFKQKQIELTDPIMDKAKKAIALVAKENGYKYVLDASPERTSVLYNETADDILLLVKKKLDSMPLATIPGAGPPGAPGIKMPPPANNTKQTPKK